MEKNFRQEHIEPNEMKSKQSDNRAVSFFQDTTQLRDSVVVFWWYFKGNGSCQCRQVINKCLERKDVGGEHTLNEK